MPTTDSGPGSSRPDPLLLFQENVTMPQSRKTPAVNDPMEGAKLEQRGKPPPPPPSVKPAVIAPPPPAMAAPPAGPVKRYRVKSKTTVSHFGQIMVLNVDDILSADSYGDDGLKRLLESVPHEELP